MCLEVKRSSQELTANKDITCYKVVYFNNGFYKTYFRNSIVRLRDTYHSELEHYMRFSRNVIERGLHSFTSKKSAKHFISKSNLTIIKCVIPKGSKYWVGEFNEYRSYASDTLTYLEII